MNRFSKDPWDPSSQLEPVVKTLKIMKSYETVKKSIHIVFKINLNKSKSKQRVCKILSSIVSSLDLKAQHFQDTYQYSCFFFFLLSLSINHAYISYVSMRHAIGFTTAIRLPLAPEPIIISLHFEFEVTNSVWGIGVSNAMVHAVSSVTTATCSVLQ